LRFPRITTHINYPFKPNGQPETVQAKPPQAVNILTALAENEHIAKTEADPERRAIALTWLFHLVGDIHQPLHSTQSADPRRLHNRVRRFGG